MTLKACTLSSKGRIKQSRRYARLRGDVEAVDRVPTALTVRFAPSVDSALLDEAVAVERDCCAFLDIDYDGRVLRIASDDPHDLDPFQAAFQ